MLGFFEKKESEETPVATGEVQSALFFAGSGEKLVDSSGSGSVGDLASKHLGKRGRGRPRKDGSPAQASKFVAQDSEPAPSPKIFGPKTPRIVSPNKSAEPADDAPKLDAGMVADSMAALLDIVDSAIRDSVRESALSITGQDEIAKQFENRVALKPVERKTISKLAETVSLQYGLAGQHTPAVFLFVFLASYSCRSLLVVRELRKLAEMKSVSSAETPKQKEESGKKKSDEPST